MSDSTTCTVVEDGKRCTHSAAKRKMCNKHYLRARRHGDPLTNKLPKRSPRFLKDAILRAAVAVTDECIPLLDANGKRQQVKWEGVSMFASRAVWIARHGDPGDALILHTCNGGSGASGCININHLRAGTADENSKDMTGSGQQTWGEGHTNHKLTEQDVREILRRYRRYDPVNGGRALAYEFGVTSKTINDIVHGKTWPLIER